MPSESTWLGRSFPPWQIYPSLFLHKVGERVFFALVCMVADCILMRLVSKSCAIEKSRTLAVVQPTPDEVAEQVAQALQDNQGDTGGTITNGIGGGASEKLKQFPTLKTGEIVDTDLLQDKGIPVVVKGGEIYCVDGAMWAEDKLDWVEPKACPKKADASGSATARDFAMGNPAGTTVDTGTTGDNPAGTTVDTGTTRDNPAGLQPRPKRKITKLQPKCSSRITPRLLPRLEDEIQDLD